MAPHSQCNSERRGALANLIDRCMEKERQNYDRSLTETHTLYRNKFNLKNIKARIFFLYASINLDRDGKQIVNNISYRGDISRREIIFLL